MVAYTIFGFVSFRSSYPRPNDAIRPVPAFPSTNAETFTMA